MLSPSTKTSLAASTHQWQVRASTNQLQVAALTCSTCYDMSAKLSSSLKDIDAQYTGTESSISSIGQLVTNAGKSYGSYFYACLYRAKENLSDNVTKKIKITVSGMS